ncbi:MAG TPA: SCO family protein [Jatrophihabitantaceae bacterium]|nr:SCO family protein [Jatrophihabitantaceae bacterium]
MVNFRRRAAGRAPVVVAAVLALGMLLAACSSSGGSSPAKVQAPSSSSGYRGDLLDHPVTLTAAARDAVFHSTAGGTTTLGKLQQGRLLVLYFGYTNCPDVCPTTMADLGNALRKLPSLAQAHTQVVFVTSDPVRDTTARMRTWLANFDSGLLLPFVGLTASIKQIDSVAKSVGVPLSPPVVAKNGSVSVEHGAQTLAFVGGRASVLWLAGTTPADYAHDIGRLVDQVK